MWMDSQASFSTNNRITAFLYSRCKIKFKFIWFMKFSVLVRMLRSQLKNLCPRYLKNLSHGCISLVGSIKMTNSKLSPSRTSSFLEVLTHDLLEYTSGDKVSLTLQSLPNKIISKNFSHFAPLLTSPQCINFKWGHLSWRYATKVVMTVHHQELLFLILSSVVWRGKCV